MPLILITGGSRSGKSAHAQRLAESLAGPRGFVATCPVLDEEMGRRIEAHRCARAGKGWTAIEEPVSLAGAIRAAAHMPVLLVDCLTLWINNVMFEAEQRGEVISEESVAALCRELAHACREHGGTVIFVTNEVGMGIVPENACARHYRDLAGRANQVIAGECDQVVLVVCGQPLTIKPPSPGAISLFSDPRNS